MEDTSAVHDVRRSSGGAEPAAPRDLRDWLVRTEAIGQITRIREPIDYIKQFSRRTKLRRSVYESLAARWSELGFTGAPPRLWALED